ANVDITPEFAVKLGAAYGSTLPLGADIVFSRDQRNVSRMVARSLIAGLMSVGINIQNLECTAIPISRTMASRLDVVGGIHVRVHPDRPDSILIEFFNGVGINISKDMEKKIEGAYFKEDFRRVLIEQIGDMAYPAQAFDVYSNSFEKHLNIETIRNSNSKIVIDYVYAVSGAVLPILLAKFDCDAVVLNASLKQTAVSNVMREELLIQLGQVVEALHGSMGAQVSANGEQLILVDESGFSIRGETLTAVMVSCMLKAQPRGTIVVPVHTSSAVDHIVRRHDGKIIRTKANPTALMEACQDNENVILGGSGDMGFIFPDLHPGFDAMFTIAKLVEMLTIHEQSLAQVRSNIPDVYYRSHSMRCPWAVKGALMRYLVEHHPTENLELVDGVKIVTHHNDDWILILPDAGESLVHIYVNSDRKEWVDRTMKEYRQRVQNFIDLEQGVTETF
ncbi:MAG: mannose-1-phosphate guanylyltransferase, partial [Synechococcaceae cyanobacterium RL_1_2]|nr:mannose-1-phosphate guanylyltransferase [Synechococcaceae cyanobacterium RL_1_2]